MSSIKKSYTHSPSQEAIENKKLMTDILSDLTALRAAVVGITAQLDADAGVTDTDYAATNDPAALTLAE